ncbi:MAG: hypothetical protein RL685_1794 [Pseudomonadota bacterium]
MTWRIAWCELLLLSTASCDGSGSRPAPPLYLQPTVIDAVRVDGPDVLDATRASTAPPAPLLPDWCGPERGELDAARKVGEVSDAYLNAQLVACAGLTRGIALDSWRKYLYDYTYVMAGCVDLITPPPGGILKFGPANTGAVGLVGASLSADDVDLLVAIYARTFAQALSLSGEERLLVEAHLLRAAQPEIDPSLAEGLAVCADATGD